MTTGQAPRVDDLPGASPAPCPCGHGDTGAEMDRQRLLIARAARGDARAFAELYDDHVDDVYRYLLAWTGEEAAARELTEQVFSGALTWLRVIAGGEGDMAAWLLTVARDAVAQHRGAGWVIGPAQVSDQPQDAFAAVERLDDAHREVAVLRLLLGHSVAHTAHLTGYTDRVVEELQLAACSSIWYLLSGAPVEPPPPGGEEPRARWFERCLEGADPDHAGDPGLSELLAVADALRQGAAVQVPLPDDAFVGRLREQLLQAFQGDGADRPSGSGRIGRAFALIRFHAARHPWVATTVAATAIGVVFGIQMAGGSPSRSVCRGGPCLVTTTEAEPTSGAGVALLPGPSGPDQTEPSTTIAATTSSSGPVPGGVPTTTTRAPSRTTVPPTTAAPTTTTRPSPTHTTHPKTTKTTQAQTTTQGPTTTTTAPSP